jgi:hypothetical protein
MQFLYARHGNWDSNRDWDNNCDWEETYRVAARHGNLHALKQIDNWATIDAAEVECALNAAIDGNHTRIIKKLIRWQRENMKKLGAIGFAADHGNIKIMKILWKSGFRYGINPALGSAAYCGHLRALKLLKKWGATHFNRALYSAAESGCIPSLNLLKEWGATKFDDALEVSGVFEHVDAAALLRKWIAEKEN